MRFMQRSKDSLAKWLSAILPVVIVGLVGLFAVTVIRDYGRETAAARQTLLEKGSVLIRALESGSRVGMGMRMHHAQQRGLTGRNGRAAWSTLVCGHGMNKEQS